MGDSVIGALKPLGEWQRTGNGNGNGNGGMAWHGTAGVGMAQQGLAWHSRGWVRHCCYVANLNQSYYNTGLINQRRCAILCYIKIKMCKHGRCGVQSYNNNLNRSGVQSCVIVRLRLLYNTEGAVCNPVL